MVCSMIGNNREESIEPSEKIYVVDASLIVKLPGKMGVDSKNWIKNDEVIQPSDINHELK